MSKSVVLHQPPSGQYATRFLGDDGVPGTLFGVSLVVSDHIPVPNSFKPATLKKSSTFADKLFTKVFVLTLKIVVPLLIFPLS